MQGIIKAVEKHRELILKSERYIWQNAETGYKEFKTDAYMRETFESLGYDLVKADDITGFYTVFDTGREGPEILILAELDSVICPTHPEANKQTGAVHSCGHNAQCAALVGVAAALKEKGVADKLCGKIRLCAVPAEELLELEYRLDLKRKGIIKHFGGKAEFLSRGYFDGVDMAFMVHTSSIFGIIGGHVGCILKNVTYKGRAAHAGGSPWAGKNALYAATCGINAVNALRETFKESDIITVHPIITNGGAMVNAIPETVTLESYVRGKRFDAIIDANKRVNRALCGAALSLGTNIEITDTPGYAPLNDDEGMRQVAFEAGNAILADENIVKSDHFSSGSTDMGDLSCIMPVVHPECAGAKGTPHGDNYYIVDAERACVKSAQWQLAMLTLLLENGGERAKKVIADFKPQFASKEEYLRYLEQIENSGERIIYNEDGTATVNLD